MILLIFEHGFPRELSPITHSCAPPPRRCLACIPICASAFLCRTKRPTFSKPEERQSKAMKLRVNNEWIIIKLESAAVLCECIPLEFHDRSCTATRHPSDSDHLGALRHSSRIWRRRPSRKFGIFGPWISINGTRLRTCYRFVYSSVLGRIDSAVCRVELRVD